MVQDDLSVGSQSFLSKLFHNSNLSQVQLLLPDIACEIVWWTCISPRKSHQTCYVKQSNGLADQSAA